MLYSSQSNETRAYYLSLNIDAKLFMEEVKDKYKGLPNDLLHKLSWRSRPGSVSLPTGSIFLHREASQVTLQRRGTPSSIGKLCFVNRPCMVDFTILFKFTLIWLRQERL